MLSTTTISNKDKQKMLFNDDDDEGCGNFLSNKPKPSFAKKKERRIM